MPSTSECLRYSSRLHDKWDNSDLQIGTDLSQKNQSSAPDMLGSYWKEWNNKSFMVHCCHLCFRKQIKITLNSLTRVAKGRFFFQGSRLGSSWIIFDRCFSHWSPALQNFEVPVSNAWPQPPTAARKACVRPQNHFVEQWINAGLSKSR